MDLNARIPSTKPLYSPHSFRGRLCGDPNGRKMQTSKVSLVVTISKVIQAHTRFWCYASQSTLLQLLEKYHNIKIKRRMLNYHLADLRSEGLIKTWKRNYRNDDGTLCLLSSATCLTLKGATFLYKLGSNWALRHIKSLKERYVPAQASKSPRREDPPGQTREDPTRKIDQNPFLDETLRRKIGLPGAPAWIWKKQTM